MADIETVALSLTAEFNDSALFRKVKNEDIPTLLNAVNLTGDVGTCLGLPRRSGYPYLQGLLN